MANGPSFWVLGAGAWGTALAIVLARNNISVTLWDHDQDSIRSMQANGENSRYLPGIPFPESLSASEKIPDSLPPDTYLLIAVPSHAFRAVLKQWQTAGLLDFIGGVCWATKGLDSQHNGLLHYSVMEFCPPGCPIALISGPSFAREVASGLPTALTIASENLEFAYTVVELFHQPTFRPYASNDIVGVEVGGAVKNVLAVAAGIVDGMKLGANARAGLVTRGLVEMSRLGVALGAHSETFKGLSGLGDLVLTCTDDQSRNRQLGLLMGQGKTREQACDQIGTTVEGVRTAAEVFALATQHGVEMPICEQVFEVLCNGRLPAEAVRQLLDRPLKAENDLSS